MKRRAIPLLWFSATLLCAWLAVFVISVATDITLFIPKTDPVAELLLEQLHSGPASRLILIGLEGGSEQDCATASKRLAGQLRETGLFTRVLNGEVLLDQDEQRKLFSYRYLLSPSVTSERFSEPGLRAALQQRLGELGSPASVFAKRLLPADPTGELQGLLQLWQGGTQQPRQRFGVWFSADGHRALMLAETTASGYEIDAQQRVVDAIQANFAAARQTPDMRLLLSGPGVFAVLSQHTIRSEAESLSAAASAIIVLIVLLAYRSLRPVLFSALLVGSAISMAVVTVAVLFGGIYSITLAFGITLLGEAIDYPILVFTHLREGEPVADSAKKIWPTMRLCAATTIIGSSAMISTDFPGLAQLGVFTIAGLLAALVFTRFVLPTLLPPVWMPRHAIAQSRWLLKLLHPSRAIALSITACCAIAMLVLTVTSPPLWEDDLAALSPVPEAVMKLDRQLRTALGAPEVGQLIVIEASDAETALQHSEAVAEYLRPLVQEGSLSGFDYAARYLPSQHTQRLRQATLPTRESLQTNLNHALQDLPYKTGLFEPFLNDVEAARLQPPLRPQDLIGTALGLQVSSLLFQTERGWTALVLLEGVRDPASLAQELAKMGYEGVRYLNIKAETNRLVAGFRDAALVRIGWGVMLIVLVVWLGVKSWRLALAALLPVCLAIILDVALLSFLGARLSLFHLVSLLLVLGIGTNYGLFFSRPDPDPTTRKRTLYALLTCCSSTLAVFGMLSLSTLPVLKDIGQTVTIGVAISFLLALVLAQPIANKMVGLSKQQPLVSR